jgi:60 kDa SS-A/Ro ribonucleoprotein
MNREIDVFEVYTDNETWAGSASRSRRSGVPAEVGHQRQAGLRGLHRHEQRSRTRSDSGMMDVVGFDTAAPQLIQAFVEGQV